MDIWWDKEDFENGYIHSGDSLVKLILWVNCIQGRVKQQGQVSTCMLQVLKKRVFYNRKGGYFSYNSIV